MSSLSNGSKTKNVCYLKAIQITAAYKQWTYASEKYYRQAIHIILLTKLKQSKGRQISETTSKKNTHEKVKLIRSSLARDPLAA